jgi:glycosyltransferase involved in cell wall biosynthesis
MTDAHAPTSWAPTSAGMWRPHEPVPTIGRGCRVLHVATRFLKGGAERNIAHFVAWEIAAGFDVELAFGPDTDPSDIPETIPVHALRWLKRSVHPLKDAMAVRELRTLVKSRRYDIVHTHLSKAGVVGRLAANGVAPHTAHTVHMASFGDGYGRLASTAFRIAERRCAPMTDLIAFVGNDLLRLYANAGVVRPDQSMVIHSPIDLERFLATRSWSDAQRTSVRHALGINGDVPLILAVGVLDPRKRYDLMLVQAAPVLKRVRGVLAIAGDGQERTMLQQLASDLGIGERVTFLGHVEDIATPLAVADLLLHTSSAEGVPQVVIQALAAGHPVVATDVTGLREIADAPITIVPHSGAGMTDAIATALSSDAMAIDSSKLAPWTCSEIDPRIHRFHERIAGAEATS